MSEVHEQAIVLKLYPNRAQADLMRRFGGATRWLWNHMLAANKARYEAEKKFIFRYEMQDMLPAMKKQPGLEWLGDAPAASFQRIAQELDVALKNCFRLKRGFPRFKSFRDQADRFYVSNQQLEIVGNKVKLPKLGLVRFRSGRVPTGRILGSVVRQEGPGWVCAVQFKAEVAPPPEPIVAAVGIDLGSRSLATLNAGLAAVCQKVEAPKPLRKALKRLRRQQRAVSRSRRRSTSRDRKVAAVGRTHRRIKGIRRNYAHQLTRAIVNAADLICVEDLHVAGMMRGRVARELADVGLGEILRQFAYKAAWSGRALVEVGRFYPSSKTCSICLAVQKIGSRETWTCDVCGALHNRDDNASINIRRRGIEIAVAQGMREPALWAKAGGDGIVLSQPVAEAAGLAVQTGIAGTLPAVRSADFPECGFWFAGTQQVALHDQKQ